MQASSPPLAEPEAPHRRWWNRSCRCRRRRRRWSPTCRWTVRTGGAGRTGGARGPVGRWCRTCPWCRRPDVVSPVVDVSPVARPWWLTRRGVSPVVSPVVVSPVVDVSPVVSPVGGRHPSWTSRPWSHRSWSHRSSTSHRCRRGLTRRGRLARGRHPWWCHPSWSTGRRLAGRATLVGAADRVVAGLDRHVGAEAAAVHTDADADGLRRTRGGQRGTRGDHRTGGYPRDADPRLLRHLLLPPVADLVNGAAICGPRACGDRLGEATSCRGHRQPPGSHAPQTYACRATPFPFFKDTVKVVACSDAPV